MKKTVWTAAMNFFGVAALIGMLDLAAASFNIAVFARMITRPAHVAFIAVFGLILTAAAFIRPHHGAKAA